MGKFFDEIPGFVATWIQQQKMFWVASAPLSGTGHVNVSPKGFEGTFHIVDEKTVWYEDLTGSGNETISHIMENRRLTIMFCAFEGPPQIVRLFGYGKVYEFGTPEYQKLIPEVKRQPGSRAVIMLDIHKVGTSCGYTIPFYTFKSRRMRLHQGMARAECEDIKAETSALVSPSKQNDYGYSDSDDDSSGGVRKETKPQDLSELNLAPGGLKHYWVKSNLTSMDGLPGLQTAYKSKITFDKTVAEKSWSQAEENQMGDICHQNTAAKGRLSALGIGKWLEPKVIAAFLLGIFVTASWRNMAMIIGSKIRT